MANVFVSLSELNKKIEEIEVCDKVKFVRQTSTKNFGDDDWLLRCRGAKNVMWTARTARVSSGEDLPGTPYIVVGRQVLECRYGPERHCQQKKKRLLSNNDHEIRRKYRQVQVCRKMNCPAKMHVYEHVRFPEYECHDGSVSLRNAKARALKAAVQEGNVATEHCFIAHIPQRTDHQHHYMGPLSEACLPVHEHVRLKICQLFRAGVRRVSEYRTLLDDYIRNDLFSGQPTPPLSDARFWPSNRYILGCISRQLSKSRLFNTDEASVLALISGWNADDTFDDMIEVNLCSTEDEANRCSDVVFVHQSRWQQRMMLMYGSDVCLIDATYRTTSYDLPLVCLCVATNVGYCNVATMLLVDEKSDSIAAGLRTISAWNPTWKPQYFMSDFHEGQILALELTFPGMESPPVATCQKKGDTVNKRFSSSWLSAPREKPAKPMPAVDVSLTAVEEDDTVENTVWTSPASHDEAIPETIYAPVRAFVPERYWTYCPDAFLESAVVSTHAEDDLLQRRYPGRFENTFVVPQCDRQPDFQSSSSVVNSLHDIVPLQIFVAMMLVGITDMLESGSGGIETYLSDHLASFGAFGPAG